MKSIQLGFFILAFCVLFLTLGCSGSSDSSSTSSGASFSSASQASVVEDVGDGTIRVQLVRDGSVGALTVGVSLTGGTAIPGVDYSLPQGSIFPVTFADGSATHEFDLGTVLSDNLIEGRETIELALQLKEAGTTLGDETTIQLKLDDDDGPPQGVLQFVSPMETIGEGAGQYLIQVARTDGSLGAVSADIVFNGGTAAVGSDFLMPTTSVSWVDGDGSDKTVAITLTDDALQEGTETANFAFANVTGGATTGTSSTSTLTIIDNDVDGEINFLAANANTPEGSVVTIVAVRSLGSGGAASIDLIDMGTGTAIIPDDYVLPQGYVPGVGVTLTWADGEIGPKSVQFAALTDTLFETTETIEIGLQNPVGDVVVGANSTATIGILDGNASNPGFFHFSDFAYSALESQGLVTLNVERENGMAGAATVDYQIIAGTAVQGLDYFGGTGTLTWGDGDMGARGIAITIVDDAAIEGPETVVLAISPGNSGVSIGIPSTVTLSIADDDFLGWQLEPSGSTQNLNGTFALNSALHWAVGDGGTILARSVFPTTWQSQPSGTIENLNAISASPSSLVIVGDNGTILTASVNSPTWTPAASGTLRNLNDVSSGPPGSPSLPVTFAVGDNGKILKTPDLVTWNPQLSGTTENLRGVAAATATHVWAVGDNGTILRSTNGGATWLAQNSNMTITLNHVFMSSLLFGWIVGENGVVLKTTDGGLNWIGQPTGTNEELFGFTSDGTFGGGTSYWAVGANGVIIKSTDFGSTWTPQLSNSIDTLRSVSFVAPGTATGLVVGRNGTIRRTTLGGD